MGAEGEDIGGGGGEYNIADWRLRIADSRIADCGLLVGIAECGLLVGIAECGLLMGIAECGLMGIAE